MEGTTSKIAPKVDNKSLTSDPSFNLLLLNSVKYLDTSPKGQQPNQKRLFINSLRFLDSMPKKPTRRHVGVSIARNAVATGALASIGGAALYGVENAQKMEVQEVTYDPNTLFIGGQQYAIETSTPSSAPTENPTPQPTEDPKILAEKEIGSRNIAEYFFGNLVEQFKQRRIERLKTDPDFGKRVQEKFINSDQINFLYLGVDETRERPDDFDKEGLGRADSIMIISFNPHTFKTTAISIPRDLYAPELAPYFGLDAKTNTITRVNLVPGGRDVDTDSLAKKLFEDATGLPIDMIVRTNIDFMQGAPNMPGIFDQLFPAGLSIDVPKDISDPEFPVMYKTENLLFKKGVEIMHGKRLTDYARTRHADTDFGRSERQRQILLASMEILFPSVLKDTLKGNTETFDKIISSLKKQKEDSNLFYDVDLIQIFKVLRNNLVQLRSTPKGMAALTILAANSKDKIGAIKDSPGDMFVSFGLGYGDNGYSLEGYGIGSMLKLKAGNLDAPPLLYWDSLRKRILEIFP